MALTEAQKAYGRKYRAEHREEIKAKARKYRKEHRAELNAYQRGYSARNPAQIREYREAHREELRALARKYQATDAGYSLRRAGVSRANARARGAVIDPEFTNATLAAILRDREDCDWCELPTPLRERRIDHRRAICFGGEHTESNIQILCKPCDKQKSSAEVTMAAKLRRGVTKADFVLAA